MVLDRGGAQGDLLGMVLDEAGLDSVLFILKAATRSKELMFDMGVATKCAKKRGGRLWG